MVTLSDVQTDIKPTKLSATLEPGNVASFTVDDATELENFENVGVGTTNRGYVKIGKEVVEYYNVNGNVVGISARGENQVAYATGTPV